MKKFSSNRSALTLVEVCIVIAIIALLAAIAIPNFLRSRANSVARDAIQKTLGAKELYLNKIDESDGSKKFVWFYRTEKDVPVKPTPTPIPQGWHEAIVSDEGKIISVDGKPYIAPLEKPKTLP